MRNKVVITPHPYVFVVLEHAYKSHEKTRGRPRKDGVKEHNVDAKLHGVYLNKNEAEGKKASLEKKNTEHGYIAVLKKPILGKAIGIVSRNFCWN